jgi:hypothetical protein
MVHDRATPPSPNTTLETTLYKPKNQIKETTGCLDRGKAGISTYNVTFGTGPKLQQAQHDLAAMPQFIVLIIFQY